MNQGGRWYTLDNGYAAHFERLKPWNDKLVDLATGDSLDDWQPPDLPWKASNYEELGPEHEEPEEEHSASEYDYMDISSPEPSDRVLRRRSKINYKEPEEDDLFIIEENPLMPSVVLQEPAPARVTYSSRPRKLPQQTVASPSPNPEGRVTDQAEARKLDNSLMAARPGAGEDATPRILKKGDPIPEAFDLSNPAKRSATQKPALSSMGDPDAEQPEPISAAYEVGDPEKKQPKPQRSRSGLGASKQNKPRVHIREQQSSPPAPEVTQGAQR